jgi:hypothetical protein
MRLLVLGAIVLTLATAIGAQASKVLYFSIGSAGTRGGEFGRGILPSPTGNAVNRNGVGSGAAAGDVYVVDNANSRIQQFRAGGDFVRAFGWDVVFSGQDNNGANEQQTVNVPNTVSGGSFRLTVTAATGSGTLTKDSRKITGVTTNTGAFAVGQAISGFGIPLGTTITRVSGSMVTLSAAAEESTPTELVATDTTAPIEWNAAATGDDSVQQRLEALPSIGVAGVTVSGGPGASGTPFTVTFSGGIFAHNNVAPLGVTESSLVGGSAGVATVSDGGGFEICKAASGPVDICQMGLPSNAAGGLSAPQGIAIDPATGNVFVTDQGNRRVDVFRADGVFEGAFGWGVDTGAAAFQFCTTVSLCQAPNTTAATGGEAGKFGGAIGYPAVGPSGNLFVADKTNRRVDQFSFTLNGSGEVTAAAFVNGFGWDVAGTGDAGNTGLIQFEVCSTVCKTPGASGANPGQFGTNQPSDVAVDSTGSVYTVESTVNFRVQKFTPQVGPPAVAPAIFGTSGAPSGTATTNTPTNIAIGPADHVFVVKAFPEGVGTPPATVAERRVQEFDPSGTLVDTHMVGAKINSVNGLSIDSSTGHLTSGRMYVSSGSSAGGQKVYVFVDPSPLPIVATGGTSAGADATLRTLEGTVNPAEFKVTACHFEYGTTTAYGQTTPCVDPDASELGEGGTAEAVHASTEPLEPETTYHYRLVASNVGGTSQGEDRTFTTGATVDECAEEESHKRRAEQGIAALLLPGCMALEMASPPQKDGAAAYFPSVSADGSRLSFISQAALGEDPPAMLSVGGATYVSSRGESGWTSEMTVPDLDPRIAEQWEATSERRPSFTPDFTRWLGIGATEAQKPQGTIRAYEVGVDGFFKLLSEPLVPISFSTSGFAVRGSRFQAASADHSHLYFAPGADATYLPGDPSHAAEAANVYLAHSDAGEGPAPLELLQRDRDDKVWGGNCGARLGGIAPVGGPTAPNGNRGQGAVSADGGRTYLSARAAQPQEGSCNTANKLRILERLETPSGPQIVQLFASECGRPPLPDPPGPCKELSGDDLYQGASLDQSRVYFTSNRQLVDSDVDGSSAECSLKTAVAGCDLYLYDRKRPAGERLVQVSAGEFVPGEEPSDPPLHEAGKEAKIFNGITAISADGSHVYFVADGILTGDANPSGGVAQLGEPNLYMWNAESEETTFLGTLDPEDGISIFEPNFGQGLWGGEGTWRNGAYPVPATGKDGEGDEVGGDGHMLVFESRAELTAEDGDDSRLDVYRYDAGAPSLECLSCAPGSSPSEPDDAPFDVVSHGEDFVPPGTDFAEHQRWVSEDGEEIGFMTPQPLVAGDVNGGKDGYLWRDGQLFRLPGKSFAGFVEADGPFLSHDGSMVAFITTSPLLPQDGDTAADVYVAQVGGGYPLPTAPLPCEPGGVGNPCQEPQAQPQAPQANSEAPRSGNPPKRRRCAKGKVRRHGRCVAPHKHRTKNGHRTRHANTDRRASK